MFWVTPNGVVKYDPELHKRKAGKFLYWEQEDLLIVAPKQGEDDFFHKDLFGDYCRHRNAPVGKPQGAGEWGEGWYSVGYQVKTPDHLKKRILAGLNRG